MSTPLFIGSAFVAKYPNGGGNFWVPLQYLRGCRDLGVEAYWLEVLEGSGDPSVDEQFITTFLTRAAELGIESWTMLLYYPRTTREAENCQAFPVPHERLFERMRDGVLLALVGLAAPVRETFARRILFDLDPGAFQIWATQWGMGVGAYDAYLTIGQNLGAVDSPVPLAGVDWQRTWPAVHLPSWPVQAGPGRRYTTITHWWCNEAAYLGDEVFDCNKRNGFMPFLPVAARTRVQLELAASIHPSETEDRDALRDAGWHLVDPHAVVPTPRSYASYIAGSRGEFSCAKPAYVKARSGWISDRTVCYLASGRPCVLQDTGALKHLPAGPGLRAFRTPDEAVAALDAVDADYANAARHARSLAESVFSTAVVLPPILRLAGL